MTPRNRTTTSKDYTRPGNFTSGVLAIAALTLAASMLPAQFAISQDKPADTFTLNLQNADISSLIETVSAHTGRNFIVDPRVKATVDVVSSKPIDADRLYELFLSVLEVHGYAAVQSGPFTKIIPSAVGIQSAVPLLNTPLDAGDELVTHVIHLENIPAVQIVETLRPLLSDSASITAQSTSNTLVVTDRAANIEKLIELIDLIHRQ